MSFAFPVFGNECSENPFARFDHSEQGADYYYLRLSVFPTLYERLQFYDLASEKGIFITDKTEFESDSALFKVPFYYEQAVLELADLRQQAVESGKSGADGEKEKYIRSHPIIRAITPREPGLTDESTMDCSSAQVSCSGNVYTFPSGTSGTAPPPVAGYPNYGCLASYPCPAWYYMQVGTAGDIIISISQVNGMGVQKDVDFICWGPFNSMTDGCATGLTGIGPFCNNPDPGCVYPKGNVVDCSYSGSNTETCHIMNAQVGQIYILLLTNFSQQPATITFSQTGGTGVTNCNLIEFCTMVAITANPTVCNTATNTFSVSGNIEFSNPAPSGTLTITDVTAVPQVSQTFTPPFVSPRSYTLNNIPCDGLTHSLTAAFSDSVNCTLTQSYAAPGATCPEAVIGGGGTVCNDGIHQAIVTVSFPLGSPPFTFTYAINGVNQAPIVQSSTAPYQIATITPGTYTLASVSNMVCTSGIISGSASVSLDPLPTGTISGTVAVCQGSADPSVTFTGASATPPYTFTYNINGGPDQTVTTVSGNSVTVSVPTVTPGTFSYNLVKVEESSDSHCSQLQGGSAVVTVSTLPAASISGTATVCQGSAQPDITFTGSNAIPPYIFTYTINGGAPQTVTTVSGNSVTVPVSTASTGTFTYSLVSIQESGPASCSHPQTGSATITVSPLPTAVVIGSTAVCQDSPAPFVTFTGDNATPPYTFTYNINGGTNQTVTTASGNSVTIPCPTGNAGTYVYNLVSVQDGSSVACQQTQAGSATVTVNPLPTATISGTIAVCKDAPAPLVTFTGGNATPPYTFTYSINGGSSLTVSSVAGNSATVAVPTGTPGTYAYTLISVLDASGTSCSQLQSGNATVTVNPLPTAAISGSVTVCRNSTSPVITFTGADGTPPYTFSYTINGGPAQSVSTVAGNTATVSVSTATAGAYQYDLVSVQDGSSTTCSQLQGGTATVIVNPLPAATISGSATLCQDGSPPLITFTGSLATGPYTFTYNINGGSNQTITTAAGNSVSLAAPTSVPGTFSYNLVSVQDGSSVTCSQQQTGLATVLVNPLPDAQVSGTTAVCMNAAAPNVTFTGSSGTEPYTFTYNINGGTNLTVTTTSGSSVNVTVPTGMPGTYSYNLVSVQDGSTTTCIKQIAGSATVTVNPLPSPPVTGPASICLNSSGTYSTTPGMTGYSWSVTPGGSVSSGSGTSSVNVYWSTIGPETISLNFTDLNGCSAATPSGYPVTVNTLPNPTVSGANSVCTGIPTTYTTQSGNNTYAWTVSSGGSITAGGQTGDNTVTVNWTTAGANSVAVNYVVGTGCTAASPSTYTVTVNPSPAPVITSPVNPICQNGSTTYATQAGMSNYNWTISPGGTITSGTGNSSISVTWGTAGAKTVSAGYTNGFGCAAVNPGVYSLVVNPLPLTTITEAGGAVCQSVPHTYQVPPDASCTFTWAITPAGTGTILSGQGSDAISINWQNSGGATVSVTGTNNTTGCSSSSVFSAIVRPQPVPAFTPCFDVITTPGAKKIILRGGNPALPAQGVYSGPRVALNSVTSYYEFDPSGASSGNYPITYTYTNTYGCPATAGPVNIAVQNASFSCGGNLTDVRDGKTYRTAMISGRCWMTQNLNFGLALVSSPVPHQTDNCIIEKYCAPTDNDCSLHGGFYQWDEIMDYASSAGGKGLCPPEWHLPTDAELQQLINNVVTGVGAPEANALSGSELKDLFLTGGFAALMSGISFQDYTWKFYAGTAPGTMYWSSTAIGASQAVARGLNEQTPSISRYNSVRSNAFSVRCVRD